MYLYNIIKLTNFVFGTTINITLLLCIPMYYFYKANIFQIHIKRNDSIARANKNYSLNC